MGYGTESEFNFIKSLGTGSFTNKRGEAIESRLALLLKYRRALSLRKIWDNIDKRAVVQFTDANIHTEIQRQNLRGNSKKMYLCPECGSIQEKE